MPARLPLFALVAALFSAGMLAGAYLFELVGGYAPCRMCYWQRWAHWAVLAGAGVAVVVPRPGARLGALLVPGALAVSAGLGAYHAGVEYGWWTGPRSCSGGGASLEGLDPGAILGGLDAPLAAVDCAAAPWSLGLSMAGWNAVLSLGALVVVIALVRTKGVRA